MENTKHGYSFDDILKAAHDDPEWKQPEEVKKMAFFLGDMMLWF